jgi:hypothetical protein
MNMHKSLAFMALLTAPLLCSAETWNNVSIVDANCAAKVKDNPDAHTRDCAMQCAKSGFGIVTADGTYLKFDSHGNDEAVAALKNSQAKDHLRATVTGDREGDTIKVKSLKM